MSKKLIKIKSLADLQSKAIDDDHYAKLAMIAARNLGGNPHNVDDAINWLMINAAETTEEGVVDEVNFCLDLVIS